MKNAREILSSALLVPKSDIPEDASIHNFEHWDSLGHMRLILELETILHRELFTHEVISIKNIGDLENIIKNKAE